MARLDKYLWAVRVFKTRNIATDYCKKGKVFINNNAGKPSSKVASGDILLIKKNGIKYTYKIIELIEKRVGAKLVANHLLDVTDSIELEKLKLKIAMQKVYREKGSGRPTKKDRRDIDGFKHDF